MYELDVLKTVKDYWDAQGKQFEDTKECAKLKGTITIWPVHNKERIPNKKCL